jgi:hypothetical protein
VIIVNLKGGLGNQMFQFATAYCLSLKNKTNLVMDTRLMEEYKINPPPRNPPRDYDLDIFGIEKNLATNKDLFKVFQFPKSYRIRKLIAVIFNIFNILVFSEKNRLFDKRIISSKEKNLYLDGHWQNEKYFLKYRNEILDLYNFKILKNIEKNIDFIKRISSSNSICVNVRRTDFINNPEHNVVDIEYYKKAINKFKELKGDDLELFIFSDDLDWCKENFSFFKKTNYVEHSYAGRKFYNYLYLMTNFNNFIIPNSSFAWWGAWLSQKENKTIIAPKKWSGLIDENMFDIVPENWISI